jgi:hypothetical protein
MALLQVEYQKGNKKIVITLVSLFVGLGLLLLPAVLSLVLGSSGLLELQGGTRTPANGLGVIWLLMLAIAVGFVLRRNTERNFLGSRLFATILVVLVVSNLYLMVSGYLNNAGNFGYGATKYLLTSIAFTIPVLLIPIFEALRKPRFVEVVAFGAVLMLIVLMVQPDSRKVPLTFVNFSKQSVLDSRYLNVAKSLKLALDQRPDTVFCVADYGAPLPGAEINFDSYFCNRWAGSINGDESVFIWGFVTLGWVPKENLAGIKETLLGKKVIIVRLTGELNAVPETTGTPKTWWAEFVEPSWDVISSE